jgi:hypothetical protein
MCSKLIHEIGLHLVVVCVRFTWKYFSMWSVSIWLALPPAARVLSCTSLSVSIYKNLIKTWKWLEPGPLFPVFWRPEEFMKCSCCLIRIRQLTWGYFSVGSAYTCHLLYSSSHLVLLYECVKGLLLGYIFGCNEESTVPIWSIFIAS